MHRNHWTAENLFHGSFAVLLCMQFAVTASAPNAIWFYAVVLPCAVRFGWHNRAAVHCLFRDRAMQWLLLFLTYCIVHAVYFAEIHSGASKIIRNTLETAAFVSVAALCFCTVPPERRARIFAAIGIVAGLCAVFSLLLYHLDPAAEERLRPIGRANTQVLGAFMYSFAALCALSALSTCDSLRMRMVLVASIVACIALVLLTQSRMALMVLTAGVVLGSVLQWRAHWRLMLTALLLLAVAAVFAMNSLADYAQAQIARGDSHRLELWMVTIQKILEAPWQGHGMLARIDYAITADYHTNSPHNIYLSTALALGVPGMVVLLLAIWHLIIDRLSALKLFEHDSFYVWLFIMGALASGMIDHSRIVKGPSPVWFIFWLPLAIGVADLVRHKLLSSAAAPEPMPQTAQP